MSKQRKIEAPHAQGDAYEPAQTLQDAIQDQQQHAQTPQGVVEQVAEGMKMPPNGRPSKRSWAARYVQPVKYEIFTDIDQTGKEQIMLKFELPAGQAKPDEQILDILHAHQKSPEGYRTGLHYEKDRIHGHTWKIQNNQLGRSVMDSIDQALDGLAKKLEGRQPAA